MEAIQQTVATLPHSMSNVHPTVIKVMFELVVFEP
jgi:hypothetical protein